MPIGNAPVLEIPLLHIAVALIVDVVQQALPGYKVGGEIVDIQKFAVFKGRNVRVWDKEITDWIGGKIISADDKSVTMEKENGEQITELFENIAKAKFISK